ncbi:MAG: lytic murein transglycosylase [Rhizomicrobium sp.]
MSGGALGSFNIFEALATLAYDGPRSDFGRTQLLAALKMMQQEKLDPGQMVSSWAGAFGQLQMLPTTFLKSGGSTRRRRQARLVALLGRRARERGRGSVDRWLATRSRLGLRGPPARDLRL